MDLHAALMFMGGNPQAGQGNPLVMFMPIILIFLVMYFFMIRPQVKKQKEHQAMLDKIEKGDRIITSGGIYGKVVNVKDDKKTLVVEIAEKTRIELLVSAVGQKVDKE